MANDGQYGRSASLSTLEKSRKDTSSLQDRLAGQLASTSLVPEIRNDQLSATGLDLNDHWQSTGVARTVSDGYTSNSTRILWILWQESCDKIHFR